MVASQLLNYLLKLAKTRKQTKLKFRELTSLNLSFFSAHENNQSQVSGHLSAAVPCCLDYLIVHRAGASNFSSKIIPVSNESIGRANVGKNIMHHSKRSFQLLTLQHAVKHKSISTSSRPQSCSNKTRLKRFGVCCRTCTCEDNKRHSKLPCQNGKNHLHHLHIKFSPKTSFQQTLFCTKTSSTVLYSAKTLCREFNANTCGF